MTDLVADVEGRRWLGSFAHLSVALALCLGAFACAPGSAPEPTADAAAAGSEDRSGFGDLENVLNWTPEQQLRGYRNMDKIYPTRPIRPGTDPYPLPSRPVDLSRLRYEVGGEQLDVDGFIEHNHVVGLLVIADGEIVVERYAQGNTPQTRWYNVLGREVGRLDADRLRSSRRLHPVVGRAGDRLPTAVLPEGWMARSTTPSAANERYGYLWWLRGDGVYSAVGIYGQAIQIDPAGRLVIVTHSAWPRATGREFSAHRTAFFEAVTGALDR